MDKVKQSGLKVQKIKAKSTDNDRRIAELKKLLIDSDKRQSELYRKWVARLANTGKALDEALQLDTADLNANERFLSNQLQQITALKQKLQMFKDKDILAYPVQAELFSAYIRKRVEPYNSIKERNTKVYRLRIQARFWDDFFQVSSAGEVDRAIKLYLEKVKDAGKIISESQTKCQGLKNKVAAILEKARENELVAKQLGSDLDKLKNFKLTLESGSLKPRDLRQIEYNLNRMKEKYDLQLT